MLRIFGSIIIYSVCHSDVSHCILPFPYYQQYWFPWAAWTKYHRLGWLKTTDIYPLRVLEVRSLQKVQACLIPLETQKKNLSPAALPTSGSCPSLWCPWACRHITLLCLPLHVLLCPSVSLSPSFPLLISSSLTQHDFFLTWVISAKTLL